MKNDFFPRRLIKGVTLVELLIIMFIMVLLTSSIFWMPILGKKTWQASIARAANRQDMHLISAKIQLDLGNSNVYTITTAGSAFSFLSAFDASGNFTTDASFGAPVWQKCVIYYIPGGTTKLLRREVYGAFTSAITPAQLTSYCDGQGSTISDSVSALSFIPDLGKSSAALALTLQNVNIHGKIDSQYMQTTIFIRN